MSRQYTNEELREMAERIVEARKGSHEPTAYDHCPCCGYDGMYGDGTRQSSVGHVLAVLRKALA